MFLGDFKAIVDSQLNRKWSIGQASSKGNKLSKSFHDLIQILDLKDIWKYKNPEKKWLYLLFISS